MTIAITGASGPLGRATAEFVLRTLDAAQVVLTTRHPESLDDLAGRGAAVRRADFSDAGTLTAAFEGVDRLLLISTDAVGARVAQHHAAITAAVAAGVKHVVYTSVPSPVRGNPALVIEDHATTERLLRESGLGWTMLRNNLYAHMQVPGIRWAATSGQLVTNAGDGATAYVTREDCAATAAAVLTQDGHESAVYDVTGPEAVTAADLVALARDLSLNDVALMHVDDAAFTAGLLNSGMPVAVAALVTSFGIAAREGFLAEVSPTVMDLTGHAPTALAEVVRNAPR